MNQYYLDTLKNMIAKEVEEQLQEALHRCYIEQTERDQTNEREKYDGKTPECVLRESIYVYRKRQSDKRLPNSELLWIVTVYIKKLSAMIADERMNEAYTEIKEIIADLAVIAANIWRMLE